MSAEVIAGFSSCTGVVLPYAGNVAPTNNDWLLCDGAAVSRTTFARLFAVIGTTWGAGNGSTTFNLPDLRGRVPVGAGSGQAVEVISSQTAAANAVPVATNTAKWITGMQVAVSGASGFTGLSDGTYYIIRASSNTIKFASTLANAQNGTAVTVTGTGSATLTHTLATRNVGEIGGEDAHAMSSTELPAHVHGIKSAGSDTVTDSHYVTGSGGTANTRTDLNDPAGGNAAMNIMQPFAGLHYVIKT